MITLERHIEILLLNNDCVIIPNFGGFMVHHVEARYDEKDQMFLPPYRTLGFNPQLTMNDYLLVQSYIEAYDMSYPEAMKRIEAEVEELKQILENEGEYELNDIGTLSRLDNGSLHFSPCEAGILTPSLYGLSSFEFEPLNTTSVNSNTAVVQLNVTSISDEKTEELAGEKPSSLEEFFTNNEEINTKQSTEKQITLSVNMLRNVAAVIIGFIVFMLIPTPSSTSQSVFIKSNINTDLLYRLYPKDVINEKSGASTFKEAIKAEKKDSVVVAKDSVTNNKHIEKITSEDVYCVVLASRITRKNAEIYVQSLHNKGYKEVSIAQSGKHLKVVYGAYETEKEAQKTMNELNNEPEFAGCWVTKINKMS